MFRKKEKKQECFKKKLEFFQEEKKLECFLKKNYDCEVQERRFKGLFYRNGI